MMCDEDRLNDHVDGLLSAAESREVDEHLAGCAICRGEERRLRQLLARAAALPRELAPRRDLWPGIRARIGARVAAVAFPARQDLLPPGRQAAWLAAAAAVLVAVTWAVTIMVVGRDGRKATLAGESIPTQGATAASYRAEEAEYTKATAEMLAALETVRGSFSPETRKVVDRNLRVIDGALEQIREALRQEPSNRDLVRLLRSTHRKKIDVLRRVIRLTT